MTNNKSSQYISFPHPFEIPLFKGRFYSIEKKVIKDFRLNYFVKNRLKHLSWNNYRNGANKYKTVAEKVLSIFQNKELLLGDRNNIERNKLIFLKSLNYFIERKKPILFNVTQFAFKIPNPLKTSRRTPDLAELAFLSQLYDITQLIRNIYEYGAKIIIYGESYVFYRTVKIPLREAHQYFKIIKKWVSELNYGENLLFYDLKKLEKKVPNFKKEYYKNLKEFIRGQKNIEQKYLREINSVANTLFLSINTRKYSLRKLLNIYLIPPKKNIEITKIRKNLFKTALKKSIPYLAYHKTINTSNLSEVLFPHSLKLSFTRGPKKICLYTIHNTNKLYPYHGVPILEKGGKVTIKYQIDLKRSKNVSSYYIDGERTPFFYTIN